MGTIPDGSNITVNPQAGSNIYTLGNVQGYGVSRSVEQPSVLLGGGLPTPLSKQGVDPTGRVEVTLNSETMVLPGGPDSRWLNRTQVQAAAGVTVQISFSDPKYVLEDVGIAEAGGTNWQSLWTNVTLTNGFVEIQGSPSGIMISGTGRAIVTRQ